MKRKVDKSIKDIKIDVCGQSEQIQKVLLQLGATWICGGLDIHDYTEPFLFVNNDGTMTWSDSTGVYFEKDSREVTAEEVLSWNPEFKPFQKVLVRNKKNEAWNAAIFSRKVGTQFVACCQLWNFCIPYKGNEYLLGTNG